MKALKITPIVTLLKPYSFMMSVRGVGEAHAIQIRNEVHQAQEKQHHPTHVASPGHVQLLHFYTSITLRKINPERF